MVLSSTGLVPATPNQSATMTVVNMSRFSRTLQLVVPSVNVNATIVQSNADLNPDEGVTVNLSYVALGTWGTGTDLRRAWTAPEWQKDITQFVFGYETPAAAMPTSGAATFTGSAYANVFRPDTTVSADIIIGGASFAVDFSSGNISGVLSNWQHAASFSAGGNPNFLPWNDVSIKASIAGGTSHFSGTTSVTSNPSTPISLDGSAKGHIVGGFYGPGAEEIGAVWSLSDGTSSALGGVMGSR
jgi:hypothetical protein